MKYEEIPWLRLGIGEELGLWPWCHLAPFVIPLLDRGIHATALMAGSCLIPLFQLFPLIPLFPGISDSIQSIGPGGNPLPGFAHFCS